MIRIRQIKVPIEEDTKEVLLSKILHAAPVFLTYVNLIKFLIIKIPVFLNF